MLDLVDVRSDYETDIVPLKSAVICVDCEMVTTARDNCCAACGSQSVLSLSSILNREIEQKSIHRPPGRLAIGTRVRIRGRHRLRGEMGTVIDYREVNGAAWLGPVAVVETDHGEQATVLSGRQIVRIP